MNQCVENHKYMPIGLPNNGKQILYCTRCGKRIEIVISSAQESGTSHVKLQSSQPVS